MTNKSDWVHEMFGDVIGNIYDNFVSSLQMILNVFDNVFTMIKGIFDGLIMFIKGVFTGDWAQAWEGIKRIFSSIWDGIKGIVVSVWNHIKTLVINIGQSVGNIISSAFKAIVNGVLRAIENILNAPIRAVNGLISVINAVPGINLGYLRTFNLPRMKAGGILNVPNKGTLVGNGSAIAGEGGHEGYIPLDDKQAMSTLGEEIGKNVVINITNITEMNGRVIGRELKQVQSEQSFAYNT